ncbi:uncharacterized protein DC041_0009918 [Schistosoma bovis]|uniref:non-specific serine/threonine protein kinase n=1 Tax=Schistosoma bovis TaxID=6184 RepID=A0A430QRF4_SCHBO|nr:uncharacterized protein DC041_0009918 [Schistosoma bovis]
MTWHDVITVGTKYLRRLHRLPVILLKQPRSFLLPRYFVPYPRICSNFGRLTKYIGNHSQANSLVRAVYRKIISSSTQQRPNSLLRVYRGFAGSVQLRHYVSNKHEFEATLDDLLRGNLKCKFKQSPAEINHEGIIESKQTQSDNTNLAHINQYQETNVSNTFTPSFQLHTDLHYLFNSSLLNSAYIKHGEMYLPVEEIVAIIAQLFEAVAELEAHGIAHRDIKPNNILIRRRVPFLNTNQTFDINNTTYNTFVQFHLNWLNGKYNLFNNNSNIEEEEEEYLNHSGNLVLLAPEIAQIIYSLKDNSNNLHNIITNKDYKHSDLWAIATLIYPLFGIPNPFIDGIDSLTAEFKNSIKSHKIQSNKLINRLCDLLNVCWAGDWLSGAARPPNGIRSLFYSRATPGRLALCLNIVYQLECFDVQHVLNSSPNYQY